MRKYFTAIRCQPLPRTSDTSSWSLTVIDLLQSDLGILRQAVLRRLAQHEGFLDSMVSTGDETRGQLIIIQASVEGPSPTRWTQHRLSTS